MAPMYGLATRWLLVLGALLVAGCSSPAGPAQPETATPWVEKPGWATRTTAVAAANPLATEAGLQILRDGGSALDAAIAIQMVLTLVEPQSSGIGGGAFLLHFDGRRTQAFDGRETAPAAATPTLLLAADGKPLPFKAAVVGGRSVGAPGTVAMLALAHREHGRLPWKRLFEPAILLAMRGFPVSVRMAAMLASEQDLRKDPVAAAYFYTPQGQPWPVGHLLRNPELAAVLQRIATEGPDALITGEWAQAIVNTVRQHPHNPGTLSLEDLAAYRPLLREPLCFDYHVAQPPHGAVAKPGAQGRDCRLCGMPPPSSGTLAMGQILGMLNQTPAATLPLQNGLPSADWLHLYGEASRLAFADRARYVADPAFVRPPGDDWRSLLEPHYLAQRAALIGTAPTSRVMPAAPAGRPGAITVGYASMPEQAEHGTSHISVVDAYGNALAMTTTIEDGWGSRLMVNRGQGLSGGFLLNNELTDFSFSPTDAAGVPVANRVEPGKRPRSTMSPTLVFDKSTGQLVLSAGSPGGALIVHFTTKTLYGVLNWGLNAQQAIDMPNFAAMGGPTVLEAARFPASTVEALQSRGHTVLEIALPSGLQAIERTASGYFGGADPRREGIVMGD